MGREDGEPCFVLIECETLDRDTTDTIRLFRSRGARPTIPLVLLCKNMTPQDTDGAYHAGVNSVIESTPDPKLLAERMGSILSYWVSLNCSISQSVNLM